MIQCGQGLKVGFLLHISYICVKDKVLICKIFHFQHDMLLILGTWTQVSPASISHIRDPLQDQHQTWLVKL
jgi:hypothetical protein